MERSDLISQSKDGYSTRNLETLFLAKPLWLSVEGGLEGSARATAGVVTSASHAHLTVSSSPEDLGTSRGGM